MFLLTYLLTYRKRATYHIALIPSTVVLLVVHNYNSCAGRFVFFLSLTWLIFNERHQKWPMLLLLC